MRTPSPRNAGSTLPHLWPTGSSRGGPHRLRPVLLLMPFGSHLAVDTLPSGFHERWLQVCLVCFRLSPSCPIRLLHTFHSLGQRGITPAFGYDAPHSSVRGTLTLLNNALLSAHYEPLRHPKAPRPSLTGVRLLDSSSTLWGFPCCVRFPWCTAVATTPAQRLAASSARFPSRISLPRFRVSGRPAHRPFRGLLGVHSRYGLHTRTVTVFRDSFTEGFNYFVTSIAAPVASGWSICRVGLSPTGKRRLFTAHHRSRRSQKAVGGVLRSGQAWD